MKAHLVGPQGSFLESPLRRGHCAWYPESETFRFCVFVEAFVDEQGGFLLDIFLQMGDRQIVLQSTTCPLMVAFCSEVWVECGSGHLCVSY